MDREMAVKLFQRAGQSKLLQIISEWLVDYGINNIWRDFKETGSMSVVWKGVVQDFIKTTMTGNVEFGEELSNKLKCIRIIAGLCEADEVTISSSQQVASEHSSSPEDSDECSNDLPLGPHCLTFFDKVAVLYPFSDVEKSHIRSALKLQVVLSYSRLGKFKAAKELFHKLYSDTGFDEEYKDELQQFFQTDNTTFKELFLKKHTYKRFLKEVELFFTPVWNKFEPPVLIKESALLEDSSAECVDARTIKSLFLAWDGADDAEDKWAQIVGKTHPDVLALEERHRRKIETTKQTFVTRKHISPKKRTVEHGEEAKPDSKVTSISTSIENCQKAAKQLKTSSEILFSGLKDPYSKMIVEHDDGKRNSRAQVTAVETNSPIGNKGAKQTTPSGTAKRRWNETRSDAHQVEWSSSSEDDDIDVNHRVTKRSSPVVHRRHLDVKLPRKQQRHSWSIQETEWLRRGVEVFGEGNWSIIVKNYPFAGRTSVHLKDRWRTLQKQNFIH